MDKDEFAEIKAQLKQFEDWVAKQRFPIDAVITTVTGAIIGAYTGVNLNAIFHAGCSALSIRSQYKSGQPDLEALSVFGGYRPLIQSLAVGSTLEQARNFAVLYAVNPGMCCVMKKFRAKYDVESSLAAGFSTGVVLSLVTGMRGPEVISVGLVFALFNGGLFKLNEKFGQSIAEDKLHDKPRDTFSCIGVGLNHHIMNFNTGFFTDNALSLLNRNQAKKGGTKTSSSSITRR